MIYAFVPARSGSSRLKDKNIRDLAGIPLIGWTLKAAMESSFIEKVIFSSDSFEYIEIAKSLVADYKKELLIDVRDSSHAGNKSKIFDYLKGDFLDKFNFENNDLVVQLLPSCPLRQSRHIDEAISIANKYESGVFAACEYDFHVSFAFVPLEGGNWESLSKDSPMHSGHTQSQNQNKYLHTNGSINCLPISLLREAHPSIYYGCRYYLMERKFSIDIDDESDFEMAALALREKVDLF
jgi:CMP-N,N'-diacetyllegionaminic acid synthase